MIKKLIKQVRIDTKEVEEKTLELERLKALCEVTGVNFEGERVSGTRNNKRGEQNLLNLIEYGDYLKKYISETVKRRYTLSMLIDELENENQRKIITLYGLKNMSMQEIADKTGYTRQNAYKIYKKGLEKIQELTKVDTN